jgi:hypothetical protein
MKALQEIGMSDYFYYEPEFDPTWTESGIAHKCAILSRFPAIDQSQYPIERARDIQRVVLSIDGSELIIYNNHWKSGASNPSQEPTRVQNAGVLRKLLENDLTQNPMADILLVGDFNCHHNQDVRLAGMIEVASINDVLGSQSNEQAVSRNEADLYNLWYEIDQQERGSEVWRGEWGTLMQIIVTPGLYDTAGIQYVDNSFGVLRLTELNYEETFGLPARWIHMGNGRGFSDHLPIYARFRVGSDLEEPDVDILGNLEADDHAPILVNFSLEDIHVRDDVEALQDLSAESLVGQIGDLFKISGKKEGRGVKISGQYYDIYSPITKVREWLGNKKEGKRLKFVGEFGIHRGRLQFVIRSEEWLMN